MRSGPKFLYLLCAIALAAGPATLPAVGDLSKLPGVHVDANAKQIRVDAQMIDCKAPLEFFCVVAGTSEHESVLRTSARPSNIHLALLMLGLEPGEGVKYSDAAKKWFPPHGPPLNISCEWEADGKKKIVPAYRLMRDVKTQKEMPPMTWIFVGSRVMEDGNYAADLTGYVVSVVNFELTLIDIPSLASSANETLEWQINTEVAPAAGTAVTLIIEPAGNEKGDVDSINPPATTRSTEAAPAASPLSNVTVDRQKVDGLVQLWTQKVGPHDAALREAAQAQYETITALRREQQRLVDEADRVQRTIDDLERKYQDMTTPRPEPATSEPAAIRP